MPIEVTWGNDAHTYTIFKFTGKWTWEEYYASIASGTNLIADTPHTVNLLIDMTDAALMPDNLLSHSNSSMRQPPRDFDLAVIVTHSSFIRVLGQMLDRLFGKKTHFKVVDTLADAHQLLAEYTARSKEGSRKLHTQDENAPHS